MKKLLTTIQADSFDSNEDVNRALKEIKNRLDELDSLREVVTKQLLTAAMFLEIKRPKGDVGSLSVGGSDYLTKIPVKGMDNLRKNYDVIQDLYDTKQTLDALEVKLNTTKRRHGLNTDKSLVEVRKLQNHINLSLQESFKFISTLAKKHLPSNLTNFSSAVNAILEKSISYTSGSLYTYVFEVEKDLVFSVYTHLKGLTDAEGRFFPEIFVVSSYRTGNTPSLYLGLMHKYAPPSEDILSSRVKSEGEAVRVLNTLFELDNFANTIGSLPLKMLLRPRSIKRDMFSYETSIASIEVDEDKASFKLTKVASKSRANADTIAAQIYKEFGALRRNTNARLRMEIVLDDSDKQFVVTYFFVTASGAPRVDPSDLEFMQAKFGISEDTVKKIARVMNEGGVG